MNGPDHPDQPNPEPAPQTAPQSTHPATEVTAARGAAITVVGQVSRVVIQLVGLVVLARLLSPKDYGLFAMVVAIIGVGEVFRDFGLSSAAVQARVLTTQQRTNLFWVNSAIGLTLTLVTLLAAQPIAHFYGEPQLVSLASLLSVTFLANGLATQFRADLNRRLRFGWLVAADVTSQIVGLAFGIGGALAGWGFYSLAAMQISQTVVALLVAAFACGWVPGPPRRGVPMRSFYRYGLGLVAAQLLGYGAKSADSIIIGATLGATPLGLYSRAFQLLSLPFQVQAPAGRIALPLLARVQDDPERFGARLVRAQGVLLHLTALSIAVPAAVAPPLFSLVLGSEWGAAAPVFRALALGGFATVASYACYWVFLSKGLTGSMFRFSLWARPLTIAALLIGSHWGMYGVATAYSAVSLTLWPLNYWWLGRHTSLPIRALLSNGLRVMVLYGGSAAASILCAPFGYDQPLWIQVLFGLAIMVATGTVIALTSQAIRRDLRGLVVIVGLLRRSSGRSGPK